MRAWPEASPSLSCPTSAGFGFQPVHPQWTQGGRAWRGGQLNAAGSSVASTPIRICNRRRRDARRYGARHRIVPDHAGRIPSDAAVVPVARQVAPRGRGVDRQLRRGHRTPPGAVRGARPDRGGWSARDSSGWCPPSVWRMWPVCSPSKPRAWPATTGGLVRLGRPVRIDLDAHH